MSVISDNLIHFLARSDKESPNRQFDIFKLIVENGLRAGKILIKFSEGASVINQIICFTDVPLRECNEHTSVYGKFGIGFKKSYVKKAGGNPARYFLDYLPGQSDIDGGVESRGGVYHNLCEQFKLLKQLSDCLASDPEFALFDREGKVVLNPERLQGLVASQIYSFSFDKEMGDLGPARDETREIDLYYKEREWRLVPSRLAIDAGFATVQPDTDTVFYKFQRDDLNMVVVPNEEMRNMVLGYFLKLRDVEDERLRRFGVNPLPVINYDDLQKW